MHEIISTKTSTPQNTGILFLRLQTTLSRLYAQSHHDHRPHHQHFHRDRPERRSHEHHEHHDHHHDHHAKAPKMEKVSKIDKYRTWHIQSLCSQELTMKNWDKFFSASTVNSVNCFSVWEELLCRYDLNAWPEHDFGLSAWFLSIRCRSFKKLPHKNRLSGTDPHKNSHSGASFL